MAEQQIEVIDEPAAGDVLDASLSMYPCRLEVHRAARRFERPTSTSYGFVVSGRARATVGAFAIEGGAGTYFCIAGDFELEVDGSVVTIERMGFRGITQGGTIEAHGRLAYIDGCSDSVLVAPPRLGDPVLNHLHFPAAVTQSVHCHPSIRLGVVARGRGVAFGPRGPEGGWERPLAPGAVFLLPAQALHAFRTGPADSLDVIAFHPDSDWGPTDGDHPMLNRTYVAARK